MGGDVKNIVAINTANSGGGAEKVAYTLCKELHLRGYNSSMLAKRIDCNADPLAGELVHPVPGKEWLYSAGNYVDNLLSSQYLFYLPTWTLLWNKFVTEADVIHFHNLHGYYFNLLSIPFLMRKKPVVWTFHDMWPFTGKCSHSFDCEGYTKSCGGCPQLGVYPKLRKDTTRFHLSLKRRLLTGPRFTIISPSEWLKRKIERSILSEQNIVVIPSPVDTKLFYPVDKQKARQELGIPDGKRVLMFIASWVNSIPSKGMSIFKELMMQLCSERDDLYSIIVGHLEGQSVLSDCIPGRETGWVDDGNMLRLYYSAADVFISPTLAENSSCTIVEAMACGTTVVAFSTGGVPEQVKNNLTGILVPTGDLKELMNVVRIILPAPEKLKAMGSAGANHAKTEYALDIYTNKHLKVYERTCAERNLQ